MEKRWRGGIMTDTSFWAPPPMGVTKMNFDGVFCSNSGLAGGGVIVHGLAGSFLNALVESGMAWFVEVAKCLAAYFNFLKARDMRLRKISLEGDCKRVITFLKDDELLWPLDVKGILVNCETIISYFDSCDLLWVKRSANSVAYVLATKGLSLSSSWSGQPLNWLVHHLEMDLCFPPAIGLL